MARIEGLEELEKKLGKIPKEVNNALQKQLALSGLEIVAEARQIITDNTNVDTGRLRGSITFSTADAVGSMGGESLPEDEPLKQREKLNLLVGTNVKYARYIEFGTHRFKPQSFLLAAYTKKAQVVQEDLGKIINKALDKEV